MGADGLEQLADEALRRPVGERDAAARAAHAHQFGGGALLVGREHHAESGQHHVEAAVGERQCLRIGLLERDVEALGRGPFARPRQQRGNVVGCGNVGPATCGGERGIAVAGRDVEHALAGTQVDGLAQLLADDLQRRADDGVVAGRPGGVLAGLDGGEIGRGRADRGVGDGHGWLQSR